MEENTWLQASMSIRMGGLGVRTLTFTHSAAYISSYINTRGLVVKLLTSISDDSIYEFEKIKVSSINENMKPVSVSGFGYLSQDSQYDHI